MLGYFGKFYLQTGCDSLPTWHALKLPVVLFVALASLSFLWLAPARAQDEPPEDELPREELKIPLTGVVRQGQGQRVLVSDGPGEQVVALLHVEVGDRRLVIMPSGRMHSLAISETAITKKPFRSATKDEVLAELKSGRLAKFKSRSTARYVYLYNTSEEFYRGTSRILETMYPATVAYFKRQKLPVHDPAGPLIVLMFRTEDEFQRYEPVPRGVAAYYSAETNHVVMYEQSDLVEMAPELAVKQAIGVVAHEGVHQILNNIGVQQRLSRWPLWTAEGLAEYFAPTSVDKRLRWKGVGMPNDFRIHELESLLKKRSNIDGEMVSQTVSASGLSSAGYASAWALTLSCLAQERKIPCLPARSREARTARAARPAPGHGPAQATVYQVLRLGLRGHRAGRDRTFAKFAVHRPHRQSNALRRDAQHVCAADGWRDQLAGVRPPLARRNPDQGACVRSRASHFRRHAIRESIVGGAVCSAVAAFALNARSGCADVGANRLG